MSLQISILICCYLLLILVWERLLSSLGFLIVNKTSKCSIEKKYIRTNHIKK